MSAARRIARTLRALLRSARRRPALALLAALVVAGGVVALRRRRRGGGWLSSGAGASLLPPAVGGSEAPPAALAGLTPEQALAQIGALDATFGAALQSYAQTWNVRAAGVLLGRRYPLRLAAVRATVAAANGQDPLARWGSPIVDPATGAVTGSWAALLSVYAVEPEELSAVATQEAMRQPERSFLDSLRSAVSGATAAMSGQWGAAARAAAGLFESAPSAPPRLSARVLSPEEQRILGALRARTYGPLFIRAAGGTYTARRDGQELLSGGGVPLSEGISTIGAGGAYPTPALALARAEIMRAAGAMSADVSALSPAAFTLKAVLVARRYPTPTAHTREAWPLLDTVRDPVSTLGGGSTPADIAHAEALHAISGLR